jgi:hypothetical protein
MLADHCQANVQGFGMLSSGCTMTIEEEEEGYVLSCVGFPQSDDLEIAFEI